MRAKLRVGAVSYLNTRPLVFGIEQGLGAGRIDLSYGVPSVLADKLSRGDLEVALLPSIELARIPGLTIVPGLGITSLGPARSVLLVAKRPVRRVRSVALDPESRTSNALTRVLFSEVWGAAPEFETGPVDLEEALDGHDAVVRIGDKALFEPVPPGCAAHDLGEAWRERTGLPFVFAVWAAIPAVVDREVYRALHDSRREGVRAIDAIALDYTWNGRQYPEISRAYLRDNMRYRLGSAEVQALRRFHASAERLGLVARAPELHLAVFSDTDCDRAALWRMAGPRARP